jgi:hypothetical protein
MVRQWLFGFLTSRRAAAIVESLVAARVITVRAHDVQAGREDFATRLSADRSLARGLAGDH